MVDIDATRKRLEELEARLQSYSFAVVSHNTPPMDLLCEILDLEMQLLRAGIDSCESLAKEICDGSK